MSPAGVATNEQKAGINKRKSWVDGQFLINAVLHDSAIPSDGTCNPWRSRGPTSRSPFNRHNRDPDRTGLLRVALNPSTRFRTVRSLSGQSSCPRGVNLLKVWRVQRLDQITIKPIS